MIARRTGETAGTVTDIRRIAEALHDSDGLWTVDPVSILEAQLERARDSYPEATFETRELPETTTVAGDHLLEVALAEVLENAIEHADGRG